MKKNKFPVRSHLLILSVLLILVPACQTRQPPASITTAGHPDLRAHSDEFRKEIINVCEGVYVAIGYGLANAILLEGKNGVIIVDTMESIEAAIPVKMAFDKITNKPVKAVIYTHFHTDHTFGASVFTGDSPDTIDVYAHENTPYYLDRIASITQETTYRRAMRQFGTMLPEGGLINCGIGPRLEFTENNTVGLVRPNKTFSGNHTRLEIAGLKIELFFAPGETNDQIFVWLPEKKVLLPGDNFYKSFPNLYAIRGTAYRDVTLWVKSLDKMRRLRPEYLVPSHSRPIKGADTIYETLTNYRDAIQFVHDQTIRGINMGLTPPEIVEKVKLPDHLSSLPYLHEYYGTVEWSVRAIFNGYLGWFGGNATDLFPLSIKARAERFANIVGGEANLLRHAREAAARDDYQWALELSDQLIALNPNNKEARQLKAEALTRLGEKQIAATARNYYLTQALEVSRQLDIKDRPVKEKTLVHSMPLAAIFNGMAVRLNPELSADLNRIVGFRFPDTGEAYTVHIRRGIAEVQPEFPENPEITITVDSLIWKEIAAKLRNPAASLIKGDIKIQGGTFDIIEFIRLFRNNP